jgi:hypothetical protein
LRLYCIIIVSFFFLYIFYVCSSCEFHLVVVILYWPTYAKSSHSRLSCVKLSTKVFYYIFGKATIKSERKKGFSKFKSLYKYRANCFLIARLCFCSVEPSNKNIQKSKVCLFKKNAKVSKINLPRLPIL